MNKQLLTLGIVLSLGSVGCAGFGVQQGSSLTAQLQQDHGVDDLWSSSEKAPVGALEAPLYAEQSLGGLWNRSTEATSVVEAASREERSSGDLWNPASVSPSWEIGSALQL
jgi:hypothetical protein